MRDIIMMNGDLVVTEFGDIAVILSDDDDIIQMANNNIATRLGENIFHPEIGNDAYNKRLKITPSNLSEVESDCKDAILYDTRVSDVTNIKAYDGIGYGECTIGYTLLTTDGHSIDGRISINLF
jgi:hypothetical protein